MRKQYHILNGDALKEQFPEEIEGEIIVARECLVDGDVKSDNLDELFQIRAKFIAEFYGGHSTQDYYRDAVSEFEKIMAIPKQSSVNLWFEDDLFCQVNFWFVASLLEKITDSDTSVYLVRPQVHTQYGFAGLNQSELVSIYKNRIILREPGKVAGLWRSYQKGDTEALMNTANELRELYPFILPAVEAHMARIPTANNAGRPIESLTAIMKELKTDDFGTVFREFNKRENIYGFGDLQVKKLFDTVKNNG